MRVTHNQVRSFHKMIFSWWKDNRRDLPWRRTRDPYRILVSEVMLQQTQVSRVLPKYNEFLAAFPDVFALANASTGDVLRIWKGMGYNRRALYLKRAAEAVVAAYHGKFPDSELLLTKLPGVGTYTARAIMVFAYEQNVAMVDTNIRQIIIHFLFNGLLQKEKVIRETADRLVPEGRAWEWHQALMDYGASALPRDAVKRTVMKKAAIPFKDSDRFIRGKILDYLRAKNINEQSLIVVLLREHGRTRGRYIAIISKLIKDGLVIRRSNFLTLPY
ncbi:MAG: hypothetical protein AAB542_02225 [Patescibacteria group bacterium]